MAAPEVAAAAAAGAQPWKCYAVGSGSAAPLPHSSMLDTSKEQYTRKRSQSLFDASMFCIVSFSVPAAKAENYLCACCLLPLPLLRLRKVLAVVDVGEHYCCQLVEKRSGMGSVKLPNDRNDSLKTTYEAHWYCHTVLCAVGNTIAAAVPMNSCSFSLLQSMGRHVQRKGDCAHHVAHLAEASNNSYWHSNDASYYKQCCSQCSKPVASGICAPAVVAVAVAAEAAVAANIATNAAVTVTGSSCCSAAHRAAAVSTHQHKQSDHHSTNDKSNPKHTNEGLVIVAPVLLNSFDEAPGQQQEATVHDRDLKLFAQLAILVGLLCEGAVPG
eukprot:3455-Heterococcus_DN1.PRE.2